MDKGERETAQLGINDQLWQRRSINIYRLLVLSLLFLIVVLGVLLYTAYVVITNSANWECTCNCTEVCNNDSRMLLAFSAEEDRHASVPFESSWITQLHYFNSTVAPIVIMIPNFTEVVTHKKHWYSDPFFAFEGGYRMILEVGATDDQYLSVYLFLTKGPNDDKLQQSGLWPMKGTFVIEELNQKEDGGHFKKVYFLSNETCSECTNRVTEGLLAVGYGTTKFRSLNSYFNIHYSTSGTVYFRISYHSTCYACALLDYAILKSMVLVGVLTTIDGSTGMILLAFIALYKQLKETSRLIFGIQVDYDLIHQIVSKDALKTCTILGSLTFAKELLPALFIEFVGFNAFHSVSCAIDRFIEVCVYSLTVCIYSYTNRKYVIVKPIWLLYILSHTCSGFTTSILVLGFTFVNIFFVNIYSVLDL